MSEAARCPRYEPFLVAEASFGEGSSIGEGGRRDPTAKGTDAFRELAGFLFGKNAQQQKMSMTTPVLTDTTGAMQFVLPADVQVRVTLHVLQCPACPCSACGARSRTRLPRSVCTGPHMGLRDARLTAPKLQARAS